MQTGTHTARAVNYEFGKSSNGNEQVSVTFATEVGNITWYGYFTEATAERTLEALEHCGWDGRSLKTLDGFGSQDCSIVVEEEEYQGKIRMRVQWVNKLGGRGEPLPADGLSALEARLADKMKQRLADRGENFKDPFA